MGMIFAQIIDTFSLTIRVGSYGEPKAEDIGDSGHEASGTGSHDILI